MATVSNAAALGIFQRLQKSDASAAAAKFRSSAAPAREIQYAWDAIARVKTTEDLFKDRRLMSFVLSAYGLDSDIQYMGRVRKVLESKLADQNSLANRLSDNRYRVMVKDLQIGDNGLATLKRSSTIERMIERYVTNEYEKSFEKQAPAVREALYFARNIGNVKSVYEILADPVLSKVVRETLGLPKEIAVQSVERQKQLIERRLNIKDFQAGAVAGPSATQKADAQTEVASLGRLLTAGDAAAGAIDAIAQRLQAIRGAYNGVAAIQDPGGTYAAEIPIHAAAVPQLLRQRGLIGAAGTAISEVSAEFGRLSQLRSLAADPANAGSLQAYKDEFAALAQSIRSRIEGATYATGGVQENLLDGSLAGPLTATLGSTGRTASLRSQDLGGFLDQIDAAAAAFANVADAGDAANLNAAAGALTTGGPALGTAREQLAADSAAIATQIGLTGTFAATLDTAALQRGQASVTDAQARLDQVKAKLNQIRAVAQESAGRDPAADRSDLAATFATLSGELDALIGTAGAGADNLLAGPDTDYHVIGASSVTARGHDLGTAVGGAIAAGSVGDQGAAQAMLDTISALMKTAVKDTAASLAIDAAVFEQALETFDARGKADTMVFSLAAEIDGLVARGAAGGANLLAAFQPDQTAFGRLSAKTYTIHALPGFAGAVVDQIKAAAADLPGDTAASLARLQDALFAANQSATALRRESDGVRGAITSAQGLLTEPAPAEAGKPTAFAQRFILRYLGIKSGQPADLSASNPLIGLLGGITGSSGPLGFLA